MHILHKITLDLRTKANYWHTGPKVKQAVGLDHAGVLQTFSTSAVKLLSIHIFSKFTG